MCSIENCCVLNIQKWMFLPASDPLNDYIPLLHPKEEKENFSISYYWRSIIKYYVMKSFWLIQSPTKTNCNWKKSGFKNVITCKHFITKSPRNLFFDMTKPKLRLSLLSMSHLVFIRRVIQCVQLTAEFVQLVVHVVHLCTHALVIP